MQSFWNRRQLGLAWTAAVLGGVTLAAGCHVHAHARPVVPQGEVVVVKKGHQHSHRCGHYKYRGKWYYQAGHVHGRGCGHVEVDRVWVLRVR